MVHVKLISLSQGMSAMVDDDDLDRLSAMTWHSFMGRNGMWYAKRCHKINGKWTTILMHRYIMGVTGKQVVDHADRNSLNNQKSNLRICSQKENMLNTKKPIINQSGFKGVSWNSGMEAWQCICARTFLGYFHCPREAAIVYDGYVDQSSNGYGLTNKKMGLL